MIVCLCHGISERTVRLAVLNGAGSVDEVGQHCRAGTDCGSCRNAIEDLIDETGATVSAAMPCGRHVESGRSESSRTEAVAVSA